MRLNRRVPVGTHGGVRGRLSIHESLLLDFLASSVRIFGQSPCYDAYSSHTVSYTHLTLPTIA